MDRGAQARTTDCLDYLYHYQPLLSSSTTLKVTDNTPHYPVGMGFLCIPAQHTPGYIMVPSFNTPTLPATILSPSELGNRLGCQSFTSFTSFDNANGSLTLHHHQYQSQGIQITLIVLQGLLWTAPFHKPTSSEQLSLTKFNSSIADINITATIRHLTHEQLHLLWHQCLGHLHSHCLSDMLNHAHAIPAVPLATMLALLFVQRPNYTKWHLYNGLLLVASKVFQLIWFYGSAIFKYWLCQSIDQPEWGNMLVCNSGSFQLYASWSCLSFVPRLHLLNFSILGWLAMVQCYIW